MITKQKQLWRQAFGEDGLDAFFATGYDEKRSAVICLENQPISALYWLDYTWRGEKFAYIYAVATDEKFRGQGYGKKLMEKAHKILQAQGYAGAILVPAEQHLVNWYEKQGYTPFCFRKKQAIPAGKAIPVTEITPEQYGQLRQARISDAPRPGKEVYAYFATYGGFYQGEDCLFAAALQGDTAYFQEFLGDDQRLSSVIAALGAEKGIASLPDANTPFAMIKRFTDGPMLDYFSFALD